MADEIAKRVGKLETTVVKITTEANMQQKKLDEHHKEILSLRENIYGNTSSIEKLNFQSELIKEYLKSIEVSFEAGLNRIEKAKDKFEDAFDKSLETQGKTIISQEQDIKDLKSYKNKVVGALAVSIFITYIITKFVNTINFM